MQINLTTINGVVYDTLFYYQATVHSSYYGSTNDHEWTNDVDNNFQAFQSSSSSFSSRNSIFDAKPMRHCRTQLWLDKCLALAYLSSGVLRQLCIFIITTSATLTTGHMDAAFIVCDILWPCCYNGQALCMACPYRLINNNAISVFYGILHDLSYLIIRISCQYRNGKLA